MYIKYLWMKLMIYYSINTDTYNVVFQSTTWKKRQTMSKIDDQLKDLKIIYNFEKIILTNLKILELYGIIKM